MVSQLAIEVLRESEPVIPPGRRLEVYTSS
jgi:hypothetical protein